MKNTLNKIQARAKLNECLKSSSSYNEAVHKFFDEVICPYLELNPSYLPDSPQDVIWKNEDGTQRVLPKENLLAEALLNF